MRGHFRILTALFTLLLVSTAASAKEYAPIVYEDNYVTVRAGISDAGKRPLYIGDALMLFIAVEFDAGSVQVESLDDVWFQRSFASVSPIRLHDSGSSSTGRTSDGRMRLSVYRQLQILDCPESSPPCPGTRAYDLPLMTIAYQLGGNGSTPDSRSARFRPWPGVLSVSSAVTIQPEAGASPGDVLPGGAYAEPLAVAAPGQAKTPLLLAGIALLVAGVAVGRRGPSPQPVAVRKSANHSRWQIALERLADDGIGDHEWSDLFRRALTWYCTDVLATNPITWVAGANNGAAGGPDIGPARDLFLDVLQEVRIGQERRDEFRNRLERLTRHSVATTGRIR